MKKYLYIAVAILTLGVAINYTLGGFAGIEPEIVEVDNYIVYGTEFKGSYKSANLAKLVEEMRSYQQQHKNTSDVVIINYIDKDQETIGNVTNFVGLLINSGVNSTALEDFEKRILDASKAIRIKIKIKPLVMPSPEKIDATALKFATDNGFVLQNLSIEQYKDNGVLIIEFPIQDKN